ncbi:MAG: hypothetical protein ABIQ47_12985 [Tepidiformaceae bacterium]
MATKRGAGVGAESAAGGRWAAGANNGWSSGAPELDALLDDCAGATLRLTSAARRDESGAGASSNGAADLPNALAVGALLSADASATAAAAARGRSACVRPKGGLAIVRAMTGIADDP